MKSYINLPIPVTGGAFATVLGPAGAGASPANAVTEPVGRIPIDVFRDQRSATPLLPMPALDLFNGRPIGGAAPNQQTNTWDIISGIANYVARLAASRA